MDYEETLLLLDGITGSYAVVYPVEEGEAGSSSEPRVSQVADCGSLDASSETAKASSVEQPRGEGS